LASPTFTGSAHFTGNVELGHGIDQSMDSSANGQLMIDGNGYQGAIALDDQAMHIYHNSSSRSLILGTNETARLTINGSGNATFAGNINAASNSFNYQLDSSGNALLDLSSSGGQQIRFIDTNSSYTEAMRLARDDYKLSLTYGWNANEEALTVIGGTGSDVGFVGIGTTSPANKLDVKISTGNRTTLEPVMSVSANGSGPYTGFGPKISFSSNIYYGAATGNPAGIIETAYIGAVMGTTYATNSDLVFATRDGATSVTEKMRILGNGNVGIGTTSNISSPLTVQTNQSANSISIIGRNNGANDEAVISFYEYDGTTRSAYILKEAGNLGFATGTGGSATEKMRITGAGKVNITKGSSGIVLYLDGVNAYNAETGIELSAGRAKISGFLNATGGTPGSSLRFYTMPDGGSVTERMRITSDGFVRIGNTSAVNTYTPAQGYVAGISSPTAGGQTYLSLSMGGAALGNTGVAFGLDAGGASYYMRDNKPIRFYTNNTFAMTIAANGNVGIGTTTANRKLTISDGTTNNYLVSAKWYKGASSFSNPFIVIVSNFTNTSSYPQIIIKINLIGHGISANRAQFTEAICTYDLTNGDLQQTTISHKTVGSNAVSAGVFSVSGTSIGFTPLRQTNYDQFKIEADIQSYSATFNY